MSAQNRARRRRGTENKIYKTALIDHSSHMANHLSGFICSTIKFWRDTILPTPWLGPTEVLESQKFPAPVKIFHKFQVQVSFLGNVARTFVATMELTLYCGKGLRLKFGVFCPSFNSVIWVISTAASSAFFLDSQVKRVRSEDKQNWRKWFLP